METEFKNYDASLNRNLKERFTKNSFWTFLLASVSRIGALIFTIFLARILMPEGYGIYSIVLSLSMIGYTIADAGIGKTFIKFISNSLTKDKKKVSAYHFYLLKIKFLLSLFVSLSLIFLSYPLSFYVYKNPQLFLPFIISAFYIFVLSFEGFYAKVFYCIERMEYVTLKESLIQFFRIIFLIFIFYFVADSYKIVGVYISLIIVHLFVVLLILFYSNKLIPELYRKSSVKLDKTDKRNVRKFIGFLTIASISGVFFSYIDAVMLGMFVKPEYVGYYRASYALVYSLIPFIAFPASLLLPVFSKLNIKKSEDILKKVFRFVSILIIPTAFGSAILGKYFIKLLYGSAYLDATFPLYFLSFAIIPVAYASVFLPIFIAREKPQILAKLIFFSSIINIILNLILIKTFLNFSNFFGVNPFLLATGGVAIATLFSWSFYFLATFYIAKKEFKLETSLKILIKPIISSIIMAIVLIYSLYFIGEIKLFTLVLLILLGALSYFGVMFLIKGVKREDILFVKRLIKK